MWTIVKSFFGGLSTKTLEILGGIVTVAAVLTGVYSAGKKSEKTDELEQVQKESTSARNIEDKNRVELRDGDAAQRLRDKWS